MLGLIDAVLCLGGLVIIAACLDVSRRWGGKMREWRATAAAESERRDG